MSSQVDAAAHESKTSEATQAAHAHPSDFAKDFPILSEDIHGHRLVYLDNAATTQKPRQVIEAVDAYYQHDNANVHRGVHLLSERATRDYENARDHVRGFIGAASTQEIIFVRGTTEAINLVAQAHVRPHVGAGDEILITHMEHHSNIVPWQLVCEQTGATLRVAPILDDGSLDVDAFQALLSHKTRFVSISHVSNALGTINPVKDLIRMAHDVGAEVLVDGAQAVAHMPVDVQGLDCEFYAFSGHKMYAPTGIGVLYGKKSVLETMQPYQGGGDMIASVTFEKTTYNELPYRFEAGTPNIAGAIGLGAAVQYLQGIGMDAVHEHEQDLLAYATNALKQIDGLRPVGTAPEKVGVLSFVLDGIHPHDIGSLLDQEGVAIRTGHHCAQPVMDRFGIPATARASLGIHNDEADVDALVTALRNVIKIFA